MKRKRPSRHNLRRIIISLLVVILASLSPNIAAADPQSDRAYNQQLTERIKLLQDHIDEMGKQIGKTARSKGMQFTGGASTNRLAGNTLGRSSRMSDRSQSRLPDTGVRSTRIDPYRQTPDTLLQDEPSPTKDRNFEIVKNRLDGLENKVRAFRRELKKHKAAQVAQNDGGSKAMNPGELSDWPLLEMEREAQRIQKEVGAYTATAEKGAR